MNPVLRFLADRFNLDEDRAEEDEIIASVKRGVEYRGTNLWTLIFAIFIASIGLNVNSTAVVIGAMLISPLMGPIQGVGMGVGINDLTLFKRGVKNWLLSAFSSVAASTVYFAITPLHEASSELLARTTPTLWDVFIALFGGLAGIVAGTRREKGNVVPGVAIATALMPPLCTAGFGVANGRWLLALGAGYLFFINSVFICLGTILIVRYLKFHQAEEANPERKRRNRLYLTLIVVATALPSVYMAYRIVNKTVFENNARRFAERATNFPRTYLLNHKAEHGQGSKRINLLFVGERLDSAAVDSLYRKLPAFGLAGVELKIRQGVDEDNREGLNPDELRASLLEELILMTAKRAQQPPAPTDLMAEARAFVPSMQALGVSKMAMARRDTAPDTLTLVLVRAEQPTGRVQEEIFRRWLKARLRSDSVQVVYQQLPEKPVTPTPPAAKPTSSK